MPHQLEFAYIGVEVSDPVALGDMLTDVVGLLHGEVATDGSPTYRNDDRCRRVFVQEGPRDDCSVLGFEAVSYTHLDVYKRQVQVGAAKTNLRHHEANHVPINIVLIAMAVFVAWGRFGPHPF